MTIALTSQAIFTTYRADGRCGQTANGSGECHGAESRLILASGSEAQKIRYMETYTRIQTSPSPCTASRPPRTPRLRVLR